MSHSAPAILYPLFAMMLLVTIVVTLLWWLRFSAIKSRNVSIKYYRSYSGEEPEYNKVVSRHYSNLFEMPVLFYLVVVMVYVTGHTTPWMVGLAWSYVMCRYVHSYVHLTGNNVKVRFSVFLLSVIVLLTMWVTFFIQVLTV